VAPWQTAHDGVRIAGGAESSQKGFSVDCVCWPNRLLPVDSGDGGDAGCGPEKLKEKGF
jgi:hypothetical protein